MSPKPHFEAGRTSKLALFLDPRCSSRPIGAEHQMSAMQPGMRFIYCSAWDEVPYRWTKRPHIPCVAGVATRSCDCSSDMARGVLDRDQGLCR